MGIRFVIAVLTARSISHQKAVIIGLDTQMYIDGYQVKLVSDTSYGGVWEVSFTLKEF